jgi:Zn-finger nucleic acid-binding protein
MKCISCETEINPQWKHAVEINVCPFCGKHIMEEHLKNLLTSLRETVDALQEYPEQLNDWLLSNHNFIKTDSPNLKEYLPKEFQLDLRKLEAEKEFQTRKAAQKSIITIKNENGEDEKVEVTTGIQSEERTNDFFKRAEVIKTGPTSQQLGPNAYQSPAEKTQHFKNIIKQIKKTGSTGSSDAVGGSMMIPAEMMDQADPEAVEEYQSLISGGSEIASSLPDDGGGDEDVPDFILAANIAASGGGSKGGSGANVNAKDLAHLQRLQAKVRESRQNVSSGAKGSFSRSGG